MTPSKKKPVTGHQRSLVVAMNRFILLLSKHWLFSLNLFVGIYVALPILAPVLMHVGATGPARLIYLGYSPLCHQMASRSFFLFGEQVAYPLEIAGSELTPLDVYIDTIPEFENISTAPNEWVSFLVPARQFLGNEQLGYKMALCERDIAIYGFVFIGGLIYAFLHKRFQIKPLPLVVFIIVGLGPIGLDGFTQLFGYWGTPIGDNEMLSQTVGFIQRVFPLRESTPFLRTFTGAVFGLMLVWLVYPHLGGNLQATGKTVEQKLKRAGELPE